MKKLIFVMFLGISQLISAEPSLTEKTDYYYVNGSTPNAIRKDMGSA